MGSSWNSTGNFFEVVQVEYRKVSHSNPIFHHIPMASDRDRIEFHGGEKPCLEGAGGASADLETDHLFHHFLVNLKSSGYTKWIQMVLSRCWFHFFLINF